MISGSSTPSVLRALSRAKDVTFSAYILRRGSPVERALELAAAKNGPRVHVRLDGYVLGGDPSAAAMNEGIVDRLQRLHADAQIVHRTDGDGPDLHAKAAVCDGVAFLDECNWTQHGDAILRDDTGSHVRAIRRAILKRDGRSTGRLALTKRGALDAEARVLEAVPRGGSIDLETEDLGASPVSKALRQLASQGVRCRVLISRRAFTDHPRTRKAALSLQGAGVEVRTATSSEKFAVSGGRVWAGSANATSTYNGDCIEWSVCTSNPQIAGRMRRTFDRRWDGSEPLA